MVSLCSVSALGSEDPPSRSLSPGYRDILSIVLVLPPAPAALVLLGLALAIFSFWSAAARRRMAIFAPPGAPGEEGVSDAPVPAAAGLSTGDVAAGDDYDMIGG
jgi:hypothetical protein